MINCIKRIVDEHPEFYLDEIQMSVCIRLKVFVSQTAIWRVLTQQLECSLQVYCESAIQ